MTIQPVPITTKITNRFVVYSKFPSWAVKGIDPLHIQDKHASFDLLVYLTTDGIDNEKVALKWMQEGENHRVKLVFLDTAGEILASWAFENVTVDVIAFEGINWDSDNAVIMRVGCSGKLASLK